jgi:preprotein translocase subunit YajC
MIFTFISSAFAQDAATAAATQPSPWTSLIPFALVFVVFYFLMIKPQKKRMQQEQDFINALKKGDEVYTKSGIIGTVNGISDKVITLEVNDGVKFKILKSQIGGSAKTLSEATVNN